MKIKQYIAAGLLLFTVSFIGGCVGMDIHTNKAEAGEGQKPPRMVFVEYTENNMEIHKDTVTGVHYLLYRERFDRGMGAAMCVMVDADGKPLV